MRQSQKAVDLFTLMPSGNPVILHMLPRFRDLLIKAQYEGRDLVIKMPRPSTDELDLDIFEERAFKLWSKSTGRQDLKAFRELRYAFVNEICESLAKEFGAEIQ